MKRLSLLDCGTPVLDEDTPVDYIFDPRFGRGLVPRNFDEHPAEMFSPPGDMDLVDPADYDALIDEQEANRSSLEHLYLDAGWENLDQVSDGYCWAYSTGHAAMLCRTRDHQPYARLEPHGMAAILKHGKNEGGWCGLSGQFLEEVGCPDVAHWKRASRDVRQDTPEMRANAALYRMTEGWVDLSRPAYDRNLTLRQVATQLLVCNNPCQADFNWWGHSVCAVRWVRVEAGSYGLLILNSWKGWGRRGLAVLRGSRMLCDGAICVRNVRVSEGAGVALAV